MHSDLRMNSLFVCMQDPFMDIAFNLIKRSLSLSSLSLSSVSLSICLLLPFSFSFSFSLSLSLSSLSLSLCLSPTLSLTHTQTHLATGCLGLDLGDQFCLDFKSLFRRPLLSLLLLAGAERCETMLHQRPDTTHDTNMGWWEGGRRHGAGRGQGLGFTSYGLRFRV